MSTSTPVLEPETEQKSHIQPRWLVVLENDDDHSMDFVVDVLQKVFKFDLQKAIDLMMEAHEKGETIIWSGSRELAELKYEQICSFHEKHHKTGKDLGPLRSRIEPEA
jgi:ATP-dependent Clp protease adaptor protein ClpS